MTVLEPTTNTLPNWRRPAVLRILLIALLAEIGYAVLNISTMPVYLKYDRNFSEGVIGLVVTAFLLSEAIFKSPMGHLADRYGRRRLMVIGPSLTIFSSLVTMVIPHGAGYFETIGLIMLRMLDGIGAAMFWPAAFALMSETVPDSERQSSMSLLNTCYLLGIALALPIGGICNDLLGPHFRNLTGERTPSLFLAASLFTTIAAISFRFVPSGKEIRATFAQEKLKQAAEHTRNELFHFLDSARRIPEYLALAIVVFMGGGFPMVIIKFFASEQFSLSEAAFGMLVLPGAAIMAGASVPMARLGERIGRAKAVHVGLGLCFAGMLMISSGAFSPAFRSVWALAIGGIPLGLGFLMAIPAWYATVSEIDTAKRAANIGAVMAAQGLGAIIGAPIGGELYRRLQSVDPDFGRYSPFLACAVGIGLGWLLSLRVIRDNPKPGDPRGEANDETDR